MARNAGGAAARGARRAEMKNRGVASRGVPLSQCNTASKWRRGCQRHRFRRCAVSRGIVATRVWKGSRAEDSAAKTPGGGRLFRLGRLHNRGPRPAPPLRDAREQAPPCFASRNRKQLWRQSPASFNGRFCRYSDIRCEPFPVQEPHPPIWVGGHSRAALRRAARHGDGWHPVGAVAASPLPPQEPPRVPVDLD
jgi:hypothetical protein